MSANDPLHDDLRAAYARFLGRRARSRRAIAIAVVGAAAAALVGVAVSTQGTSSANASGPGSPAYIQCLNDHGWSVGDGLSIDPNGTAPDADTVDAAVAACADLEHGVLDALRPSDEALQQLREQANRFATCMRAHGVDVGAPDVFRRRVGIGVTFPSAPGVEPGFDSAYAACKPIMRVFG